MSKKGLGGRARGGVGERRGEVQLVKVRRRTSPRTVEVDLAIAHLGDESLARDHRHPHPFQDRVRVHIEEALRQGKVHQKTSAQTQVGMMAARGPT